MALRLVCPHCRQVAPVSEEHVGSIITCSGCGREVFVPEADPTGITMASAVGPTGRTRGGSTGITGAPGDRGGPLAPGVPEKPGERHGWKMVDRGLVLMTAGVIISVVSVLVGIVYMGCTLAGVFADPRAAGQAGAAPSAAGEQADTIISSALLLLSALSLVCFNWGRLSCCAVPARTRARGLAWAALAATFLATLDFALLTVLWLTESPKSSEGLLPVFAALGGMAVLVLAGEILFLVFLYRVGIALDSPKLTRAVRVFGACLFMAVVLFIVALVGAMLFVAGQPTKPDAGPLSDVPIAVGFLILVLTVIELFLLAAYSVMLSAGRNAVRERPGAGADKAAVVGSV